MTFEELQRRAADLAEALRHERERATEFQRRALALEEALRRSYRVAFSPRRDPPTERHED